ncbi:phosphatidylglycerophosphatase A [Arsenophonus endosymbiont of Aphis craccivora]|uniref:phosphatidylglycerophosphatase A n=1 Tax=Arsenophonus endosymbiont of Aphis craccivora TaxID=1231049 RepID=UPI0015DC82BB|nr:phosphatidylglycerophosphatase A [Arsenophonus endosymbiont of Aphis craccivora]QLK87266.1 phosphatidylglycerophosphatase A [Arsenophonus endosymbiont of Aphis craccivora]
MTDAKSRLKLSNPWHLLATGFGSGLSPIIHGTMGSLAAIPFWLLMYWLLPVWLCWFIILFGFVVGIVICQRTSDDMQVHDHGSIVWDEFIGMWMTLMVIPLVSWQWVLIVFVLFRFFDMLKPWPIGWFDRQVGGGLGIMLDDIIAAIFAMVIVAALAHWLPVL